MRALACLMVLCWGGAAFAQMVVPTRTIRAASIITEVDVMLAAGQMPQGFERAADVIGQEARVTLYAGRPILVPDVGPPALVTRNQIVSLRFEAAGLIITTEGRALDRGGVGDRIRIMNLTSRSTLFGLIKPDGAVQVYQ
mgnify:CR=1 FL=1